MTQPLSRQSDSRKPITNRLLGTLKLTRLNLQVALTAAANGSVAVVDATRSGKRFPDALSKTVTNRPPRKAMWVDQKGGPPSDAMIAILRAKRERDRALRAEQRQHAQHAGTRPNMLSQNTALLASAWHGPTQNGTGQHGAPLM